MHSLNVHARQWQRIADISAVNALQPADVAKQRTLTVKAVKKSDIDCQHTTITNWTLTDGEAVARIGCGGARSSGGHLGYHRGA